MDLHQVQGDQREGGGRHPDQHVCPQPGGTVGRLALEADHRAERAAPTSRATMTGSGRARPPGSSSRHIYHGSGTIAAAPPGFHPSPIRGPLPRRRDEVRTMRIVALGRPLEPAEVPEPVPGPGEVLVRVRACGLNFADTLLVAGRYQEKPALPFAPGSRSAARRGARPGRRRAGAGQPGRRALRRGGLAELVALPAAACARVPDAMPDEAAAGFLVAYGTSHVALAFLARLRPGETLLVTGAAGGVGLTAVELGALIGARVVAVARGAAKRAAAAAAGAALTLDAEDDVAAALSARRRRRRLRHRRRRAVRRLPARGEAGRAAAADRLRRRRGAGDPRQPALGEEPDGLRPLLRRLGARPSGGGARQPRDAVRLAPARAARPHVGHVLPLAEAEAGLELIRSRAATGKVVVRVADYSAAMRSARQ